MCVQCCFHLALLCVSVCVFLKTEVCCDTSIGSRDGYVVSHSRVCEEHPRWEQKEKGLLSRLDLSVCVCVYPWVLEWSVVICSCSFSALKMKSEGCVRVCEGV